MIQSIKLSRGLNETCRWYQASTSCVMISHHSWEEVVRSEMMGFKSNIQSPSWSGPVPDVQGIRSGKSGAPERTTSTPITAPSSFFPSLIFCCRSLIDCIIRNMNSIVFELKSSSRLLSCWPLGPSTNLSPFFQASPQSPCKLSIFGGLTASWKPCWPTDPSSFGGLAASWKPCWPTDPSSFGGLAASGKTCWPTDPSSFGGLAASEKTWWPTDPSSFGGLAASEKTWWPTDPSSFGVLQPPYRKPSPGSSLANEWFLCQNFAQLDHFRPWRCYLELQNAPQVLQVVILQLESFLSTSDSHSGQRPKVVWSLLFHSALQPFYSATLPTAYPFPKALHWTFFRFQEPWSRDRRRESRPCHAIQPWSSLLKLGHLLDLFRSKKRSIGHFKFWFLHILRGCS